MLVLSSCGNDETEYSTIRDVSWAGKELTIFLGTNKSTGCEWTTRSQDDSIIDYSVNRTFRLSDEVTSGEAIGVLEAGFEGKGPGTTQIICETPVGWDGTGKGYSYVVTVTVSEDGIIETAFGE